MDYLIKYRNDRKQEGASKAELNGLDGRINAAFSAGVCPMDLELLMYRREIAAGGNKEFLARLDMHIFHQLGSKPARIVEVAVNTPANSPSGVYIAVDLANETIGDLSTKAQTALGSKKQGKLIFMGHCYEDPKKPLSETPLCAGAMVVIVGGNRREDVEIAQTYARLCDADLRSAKKLFDKVPADKLHELFVVVSNIKTESEPLAKPKFLRCLVEPKEPEMALWAHLSTINDHENSCRRDAWAAALLRCEPVTKPESPTQAIAVARLCTLLSEKPATSSAPENISDEDLYA
jgi:hypothetical protein